MFYTKINLDFDRACVIKNIFSLSEHWVSRSTEFPFYTLGRCAYLDGRSLEYNYDRENMNEILHNKFKELYQSIINNLQDKLEEDIYLADDLRYPGFHIFPSDKKFLTVAGNWHTDYPNETLGLGNQDISTITIPIMIPESGAGIDYIIDTLPHHIAYTEKEMIWHKGDIVHRISSFKEYKPNEYRITMQGHLVRRNNKMELYW